MTSTVLLALPPLDPTCEAVPAPGERLLDLSSAFWRRLGDPASVLAAGMALDVPQSDRPGGAELCLMALAAADALAGPAGPATRLRGLGAAARVLSADDRGLTVSVDDVQLVAGSVESSADVAQAVSASTLMSAEVERAAAVVAGADQTRVLISTDQQLPAVFGLLARVSPERVTLVGRFVSEHGEALRRVPALRGARMRNEPRAMVLAGPWAGPLAGPWAGPAAPRLCWIARAGECPPAGMWAGWLDAAEVTGLADSQLARCAGLVVTVSSLSSWALARGADGQTADLTRPVSQLVGHVPVALELLAGAPGISLAAAEDAVAFAAAAGVRIAGCRMFRLAAGYAGRTWAGATIEQASPPGHDLAMWRGVTPGAADVTEVLLERLVTRHDLFPGRVAAVLFTTEDALAISGGFGWNPAVRQVRSEYAAPAGVAPGDFLVNLRTGRINRISPAMAALTARLRCGGPEAAAVLARLPAARGAALTAQLSARGILAGAGVPKR